MRKSLFIALASSLLFIVGTVAVAGQVVILITSPGCTKCAAAGKILDDVIEDYPGYKVREEIFYSDEGRRIIKEHNAKDMPSVVIGDSVIGYRNYDGDLKKLEGMIRAALEGEAANPPPPGRRKAISSPSTASRSRRGWPSWRRGSLRGSTPASWRSWYFSPA